MGVRGLTTFIANRSHLYLENYKLQKTYLVLDGNNIAAQLYKWHCKCNDCFGGDYDKYATTVKQFLQLLSDANITPLVVFDGGYEKRKLRTVYLRMQNKIDSVKQFTSITEGGKATVFPLFLRELFVDLLLEYKIKCVRCDFEADKDMACIARTLQCPVLSYDSDFYIFDVVYIPFSSLELKLYQTDHGNYLSCQVYRVEKFLNSFGGLDKVNLPILATLLGNDYIKKEDFSQFYNHLKFNKRQKAQSEQQRRIKAVVMWLKNETPQTAIEKILGRFKLRKRQGLERRIRSIVQGYECVDSTYLKYLKIDQKLVQPKNQPAKGERTPCGFGDEGESPMDEDMLVEDPQEGSDESMTEETDSSDDDSQQFACKSNEPFQDNFRRCVYPSCFMDILMQNCYYTIPQVEDYTQQHSHTISLKILSAIYKILMLPISKPFMCIARDESAKIRKFQIPDYPIQLPTILDIEVLNKKLAQNIILNILGIQADVEFYKFLENFPTSWALLLISIKYWVTNSTTKVELVFIYAIILCGIVLNYVDKHFEEFNRSTKIFTNKYGNIPVNSDESKPLERVSVAKSLDQINFDDSVQCLKELIQYFQMDAKMKSQFKLFNRNLIHQLAEFQSCLLHIKYLNCLFKFPFDSFLISNFYDGTFIYNMIINLKKRTNLEIYVKLLLKNSPTVLNSLELIMGKIREFIVDDNITHIIPKKRRKKRKNKQIEEEEGKDEESVNREESEDEGVVDANNRFALLSSM